MNTQSLLSQVTYADMKNNPELCGRLLAYLEAALHAAPANSFVHKFVADGLARDLAKVKESR